MNRYVTLLIACFFLMSEQINIFCVHSSYYFGDTFRVINYMCNRYNFLVSVCFSLFDTFCETVQSCSLFNSIMHPLGTQGKDMMSTVCYPDEDGFHVFYLKSCLLTIANTKFDDNIPESLSSSEAIHHQSHLYVRPS